MSASAFRVTLRIARRDAWRARWRSALVILLIGLPVLVLAAVDVGWRTYQLSPAQRLDRAIGVADLAVQTTGTGGLVRQTPKGWLDNDGYSTSTPAPGQPIVPPTRADLVEALPAGSTVIARVDSNSLLAIRTAAGLEYATETGLDYANPIARGLVTQLSGRAPHTTGEAAITAQMAHETGLKIGQTMTTFDGDRTFRIVGIVRDAQDRDDVGIYNLPPVRLVPHQGFVTWLIHTQQPVSWASVLDLNDLGFVAVSRHVYLDPPPASQVTFHPGSTGPTTSTVASIGLVAGMALLEVILLAGPAFAVSARRQRRDLALLAATGGRARDLRNVVLANGLVLGLTAGVVGVVAGIGLSAAALAGFADRIHRIPGPFDVRPLDLAGIALVSLVTAILAALVPAWAAARIDVMAALAGRRGELRIRRRVPVFGLLITALGVVVALFGAGANRNVNLILAGVAITELGLIILTPSLITLVAKLGRWLPFTLRLALRDASRNRSSTAPAVAAVMAAMIGAIAVALIATSQTDLNHRRYQPRLPPNAAYVPILSGPGGPLHADVVAAALRSGLSTAKVVTVHEPGVAACIAHPVANSPCSITQIVVKELNEEGHEAGSFSEFGHIMVDDGSAISAMLGVDVPAAEAALREGTVVTTDPSLITDGKITIVAATSTVSVTAQAPIPPTERSVSLPAIAVTEGFPAAQLILPTSVATSLVGLPPQADGVLATLTHRPTSAQRQGVNKTLAQIQPNLQIATEDGFQSSNQWEIYLLVAAAAIVALGAAAVATVLANVDGRADLVTLGAVGASPRTRRLVSVARAGVTAGLGCLIGTAAGFVPAVAWIERSTNQAVADYAGSTTGPTGPQLHLVVPWPEITVAAIGVPVAAMLIAALFTGSRLPSERRVD